MNFFKPERISPVRAATLTVLLCSLGILQACSTSVPSLSFPGVYRITIPQGNIITQDMVDQLRPGLNKRQVTYIMGTPLVRDTFNQDRWDYVYSIQPGGGERMQERITLYFDDGELTRFEGDFEQSEGNRQFAQTSEERDNNDDQQDRSLAAQ